MNQSEKAARFTALHVKGAPLVLYNAWDAGSAKSIVDAGAKAIATSSWAVAEAQGYRDGEAIPLGLVEQIIARITNTIDVPVTVDFEGGYSDDDNVLAENRQARRIAAIRDAADKKGINFFINARTDLFLGQKGDPAQSVGDALDRAKAYASAGASGFFVPGLQDDALIGRVCEGTALPVNVMMMDGVPSTKRLLELGVARISYGPIPYFRARGTLQQEAKTALS